MKKSLMSVVVAAALAVCGAAMAKPGHGDGMQDMLEQLDLSKAQKQELRKLHQSHKGERGDIDKDAMQQNHAALNAEMEKATFNANAVRAILQAQQAASAERHFARAQGRADLLQVLNDEQEATLEAMAEERMQGHDRDMLNSRWAKRLNLTDEQKSQIAQIKTSAQSIKDGIKSKLNAFRDAEKALISSDSFNRDSWNALYQQYQPAFIDAEVQAMQARHDVMQVLTDEQRTQLAAMRDKFKDKMQKHHRPQGEGKRDQSGMPGK